MMLSMRGWGRLVASLVMAGGVGAAVAQVPAGARASVQQIGVEFYDARPDDGIQAQAWFVDPNKAWRQLSSVEAYLDNDAAPYQYYADGYASLAIKDALRYLSHGRPLQPMETYLEIPAADGFGAEVSTSALADGFINAQGAALQPGLSFSAITGLSTSGSTDASPSFYNLVLGAGTGVRLVGYGMADVEMTRDGASVYAAASLFATFSRRGADGGFQVGQAHRRFDVVDAALDRADAAFETSSEFTIYRQSQRWMSLSYENLSNEDEVGRIRFLVSVDGEALAPVPEPQTALLLGLGLVVLGAGRLLRHRPA